MLGTQLEDLLEMVNKRLTRKTKRAEDSYVTYHTIKSPKNCKHSGRMLTEGICVCKVLAWGKNELDARQCWAEKARICPKFSLQMRVSDLRAEFRGLEDLGLRYPSLNELAWVKAQLEAMIRARDNGKTEPVVEVTNV